MIRIAMLGSGFIGRFYAESIQGQRSKDKIVSIYARKEENAKKFADDYGCTHFTTDMEAAIAHPDVDMVCIALPNYVHEEAVMLCCKHKKAVITTKPLGRNGAEALRMLQAVEAAGIFNGYLEDLVYTPKFLKAFQSVQSGALGRILWAKSRETHPGPHSDWFWNIEQAGGGCILDLGCHCIEIGRSFIGKDILPVEVMCWATERHRAGMGVDERAKSLHRAFRVRAPRLIANKTLLVVDDVMTTGSTAHEIAQALLDAGAQAVKVLTLARAVTQYI